MIRAVIALFTFAILLCGWIVLRDDPADEALQVTRNADAGLVLPTAVAQNSPAPVAPRGPSALRQRLAAQGKTTLLPPPGRSLAAAPDAANIEAAVLQALAPVREKMAGTTPSPAAAASQDLGQSALAGILRARGLNAAKVPPEATRSLGVIVAQALQEGQPDAYVEALLQAAHREGMYQPDAALLSESGQVDARTMLSQIVRQAGGPENAAPPENIGGAGVELRTVQRADRTETYRFYTVQPGDSLGYIAQKFYGDASFYPEIWEANRSILSSPDRIRKGQRLVIPKL